MEVEDLVKTIPYYGGNFHEDVVQWLHTINEIFDRMNMQPSHRYLAVQSFLTKTAASWFRYSRNAIPDWSTFQVEIIKTFQPISDFRFLSPPSTKSQMSSQEILSQAHSPEPEAVPVVESQIVAALESPIRPDTDTNPDADPILTLQSTPDEKPNDPNVNPDSALDVESDPRSTAEPANTVSPNDALQTVADDLIQVIIPFPRFPSLSPVHVQYRRGYERVSHKPPYSQTFLLSCDGASRSVSFAGPVSFNTVHHQWRYKCERMHGSHRIFQHERFKLGPRLGKWKYRRRTIFFLRS